MLVLKLTIFIVVSCGIVFLSWKSFRNPRSYGFFRFFAFEFVLVLILLNLDYWFRDPFSAFQIVSWVLLLVSLVLAAHGFYLLRAVGRPKEGFEDTTALVVVGIYKYIRHPLYSSLLFLAWGVFFKAPSIIGGILAVIASAFIVATARAEESEDLRKFGADYAEYTKATKMFIPFVF